MTAYAITGTAPNIFVVNGMGETINGPYKNDESAKRRIRELKRKDAATTVASDTANEMARDDHPRGPVPADVEEAAAELYSREIATNAAVGNEFPNADKLAASSAYGRMNNPDLSKLSGIPAPVKHARTAGVYPAVGKNEYRRRWHYA